MDAQTRRRERRAEKQAQWKAANPLLVGVSAKPVNRPILSLNRKPKSRVESALNPIDLTVLAEYHEQIESNLQRIERKNAIACCIASILTSLTTLKWFTGSIRFLRHCTTLE